MSIKNCNIPFNPTRQQHRYFINLTGKTFQRLTVLGFYARQNKVTYWLCQCVCQKVLVVRGGNLTGGHSASCGCLNGNSGTHGDSRAGKPAPEYRAYAAAKTRCTNQKTNNYAMYGGRGIKFLFESYEEFLEHIGRRPSAKHSLDRIDSNGHYEKGNVRWATIKEQCRNTRRNTILTVDGISRCVAEWADIYKMPASKLHKRHDLGWCDDCVVKMPFRKICAHIK